MQNLKDAFGRHVYSILSTLVKQLTDFDETR